MSKVDLKNLRDSWTNLKYEQNVLCSNITYNHTCGVVES